MIIILWVVVIAFAFYCIDMELTYRAEMKKRSLKIGDVVVYWEGVPGYQTNLIVLDKYGCKVESIPFIQHYQAISHSRRSLEDFYRGMMKRHNRKKAQEQHEQVRDYPDTLDDECPVGIIPEPTLSRNFLNKPSSQVGVHDW